MKRLLLGAVAGIAIGAGAVAMLARGDTARVAAPAETTGLAVERSDLRPGVIVLFARNDSRDPVRVAQVMVNDAYVGFRAAHLTIAPRRQTQISVRYPWIAGESYEIGLLTGAGAIVEYELEDAGET